ncbi:MAG: phosphodiester glycosidase family protein [Sphingomonadaceae bacterium]
MRLLLCTVLFTLAACGQQPAGEPVMRTEIGSGKAERTEKAQTQPEPLPAPTVASACRTIMFEEARFTHCVADAKLHRIVTDLGPAGGPPYRSLANLAASRPADAAPVAFAVNGGMFDDEGKPIGYYVEGGKRLKELNRNDGTGNFHLKPNGVFFGTGSKWQVRTADDFFANVADRPEFGTQSGPMLVIGGKIHPEITENGPSRTIRNGVGVDAAGRAHFVQSAGAVSFGVLARLFRDELKTPNALYLDGSVSSLWDPASERLDIRAPLGPLIIVETR